MSLVLLSMLASAAAACSSAVEPASASESDVRIRPGGNEKMARLTVALPRGTCWAGQGCARAAEPAAIGLDGARAVLGAEYRLSPGAHTLKVGDRATTITLAAGETRNFVLSVVQRACKSPSLPETHFGRIPSLGDCATVTTDGLTMVRYREDVYAYISSAGNFQPIVPRASCADMEARGGLYVDFPGGYRLPEGTPFGAACAATMRFDCPAVGRLTTDAYRNLCEQTLVRPDFVVAAGPLSFKGASDTYDVKEGDVSELAFERALVGGPRDTFATTLTFADPRELPNAERSGIRSSCERNYEIPAGQAQLNLRAFKFSECAYELYVPGRTLALGQDTANAVTLHRIDVDDVQVAREDGTTYTVRGTYELHAAGARIAGPFPTNTGIDALPGDYEIVVQYGTALGNQTARHPARF